MRLHNRWLYLLSALTATFPVGDIYALEQVSSHASLQVRNLDLGNKSELNKLAQKKEEAGELSAADERKYRQVQRATERELLQVSQRSSEAFATCKILLRTVM